MLEKLKSYYILIEPGDTFGVVDTIASDRLEDEYNAAFGPDDSDSSGDSDVAAATKAGPRENRPKKTQSKARHGLLHNRHLRKFTVQCIEEAEFIMLTLDQLEELRGAFPEVHDDIFANQDYMLWLTLRAKQRALELLDPGEHPEEGNQPGSARDDWEEVEGSLSATSPRVGLESNPRPQQPETSAPSSLPGTAEQGAPRAAPGRSAASGSSDSDSDSGHDIYDQSQSDRPPSSPRADNDLLGVVDEEVDNESTSVQDQSVKEIGAQPPASSSQGEVPEGSGSKNRERSGSRPDQEIAAVGSKGSGTANQLGLDRLGSSKRVLKQGNSLNVDSQPPELAPTPMKRERSALVTDADREQARIATEERQSSSINLSHVKGPDTASNANTAQPELNS